MKLFLKNTAFFLIILIAILFVMQGLISFRIDGKTVRDYDNLDVTSNVNADLVLMGSSRCWAHFDPVFFDSTFNLKSVNIGVDGHPEIAMTILRLENYLSKNKAPKYAILSLDPLIYAGSKDKNQNFVHKDAYSRYSFLPDDENLALVNYFKFDFSEKYVPLYSILKNGLLLECIRLKNSGNYKKYGFAKHEEQWDTIKKPVTDALKKAFFTEKDKPSVTHALKELNQFCIKNNIKLLCIQTPVYKVLADKSFGISAAICRDLNIPFIDVNQKEIQNNINFFYNSNHLNAKGVEKMNSYLREDKVLAEFLNSN